MGSSGHMITWYFMNGLIVSNTHKSYFAISQNSVVLTMALLQNLGASIMILLLELFTAFFPHCNQSQTYQTSQNLLGHKGSGAKLLSLQPD